MPGRPPRIEPGPEQESAWDYPRPPRIEPVARRIRAEFGGLVLADSTRAFRAIETAGAPVYYLPPADVRTDHLERSPRTTICEWKGIARYFHVRVGDRFSENTAWSYPDPLPGYEAIRDHLAFYLRKVDAGWVGDERAKPQPGRFYGGWITSDVVGPFKGDPGSEGW